MPDEDTPVNDGTVDDGNGGTTGDGATTGTPADTPDYGEFDSLDDLKAGYTAGQDRVSELDSLRGKQGSELSELRTANANLTGQIKGLEVTRTEPAIQPETAGSIQRAFDSEEITQGEALIKLDAINRADYDQKMKTQFAELKQQSDKDASIADFLRQNDDYEALYSSGALDKYPGMSGEQAYAMYHKDKAIEDFNTFKTDHETKIKEATEAGKQEGLRLAKGNAATSKVVGATDSGITDTGATRDLSDNRDRLAAGRQHLAELRGQSP